MKYLAAPAAAYNSMLFHFLPIVKTRELNGVTPLWFCRLLPKNRDKNSLVSIHPFYDGNGRTARLIANLPCMRAGLPPIIIDKEKRYDYVRTLAEYQHANGVPDRDTPLVHEDAGFHRFCSFCQECWQGSMTLVEQAHSLQKGRERRLREDLVGAEPQ